MWALAAGFYVVAIFHRMSLGVASLDASHRFGVSTSTIAVLSIVQLGLYLTMQVPAGLLADRLGPRRSLALGLVTIGAGELLFAFSPSFGLAIAGRALVGAGDACMFLNVLRVAAHWLPPHRYALATALTGVCGSLGQLLTTAPLSAALGGLGWTPTFAATGVLTAVLAILAVNRLQDRPSGAAAAHHAPIVPTLRRAWRAPSIRHGLWVHFALNCPFVTLTGLWAYPYLVQGQGLPRATAAAILTAAVVAFGVAAPVLGALAGRIPHRRGRIASAVAFANAAALGLVLGWPGHPPLALVALMLVLSGVAGAASMLAFDLARDGAPNAGGSASGMVNIGGFGATILAQAAIGLLVSADLGYRVALLPLLALVAVGALQTLRHPTAGPT
ncbi:MFS transporter [Candidatus Solirubrobacter pratensis]|uniref:MFS transporter n=1 Tax=Candidatus Solirubrobacter pratensis TaxID=1298857 RepID=UPI00040DF002|nr:MFS transporter [Candidatus Solirubrobacter pratensis]